MRAGRVLPPNQMWCGMQWVAGHAYSMQAMVNSRHCAQACRDDIKKYCKKVGPGGDPSELLDCLRRSKKKVGRLLLVQSNGAGWWGIQTLHLLPLPA